MVLAASIQLIIKKQSHQSGEWQETKPSPLVPTGNAVEVSFSPTVKWQPRVLLLFATANSSHLCPHSSWGSGTPQILSPACQDECLCLLFREEAGFQPHWNNALGGVFPPCSWASVFLHEDAVICQSWVWKIKKPQGQEKTQHKFVTLSQLFLYKVTYGATSAYITVCFPLVKCHSFSSFPHPLYL